MKHIPLTFREPHTSDAFHQSHSSCCNRLPGTQAFPSDDCFTTLHRPWYGTEDRHTVDRSDLYTDPGNTCCADRLSGSLDTPPTRRHFCKDSLHRQ
ncbi:hypothetical protein NDU88_006905 [Pleurodeles waltl]|uniref:Uncharacterized protein n=1 Tax=Pleurodeles waltl TaxID=8319 RepID=A0AAV7WG48_PLEWA|nr:hypothetical protein NDU88_006905 [Pleurodeles waltl]